MHRTDASTWHFRIHARRETSGVRDRVYEILFEFIPEDEYLEKFSITQAEVMAGCEHFFAYRFLMALIKSRKGRGGVGEQANDGIPVV